MSYIEIQTTQNINLEYETASVGERVVAAILDRIVWVLWIVLWVSLMLRLNIATLFFLLFAATPIVFYYLFCELWFNGQSIGKRIISIRVAKIDGTMPSFGDYFLRWVFRLVDNAAMSVIFIVCTPNSQRLGDKAAKTTVIRIKDKTQLVKIPEASPDHRVTFDNAILLSDRDVSLIEQIMANSSTVKNKDAIDKLATKVKEVTGTESELADYQYLKTILSDYKYLAGRL